MDKLVQVTTTSTQRKPGVEIKTHCLDDSSWAWGTLMNIVPHLLEADSHPGRDEAMEVVFKFIMEDAEGCGLLNVFGSPVCSVTARNPSTAFFREARRAQTNWFRQSRNIIGGSGPVKRAVKQMSPIVRQLSHTGVLVVDGKHILPNMWPDRRDEQKLRNVTGHRFGSLVVAKMLKHGSCLCQCDCGQQSVVRRSHLINGSTGSCECLKAEEVSQKLRKDPRT
jgi:hypothetical protein